MQQLPTSFKKPGYLYAQIAKSDKAVIYKQSDDETGQVYGYEVMEIKVSQPERAFGRDYPLREVMPGNNEWGTKAFTYSDHERAVNKFTEIKNKPVKP